MGSGPSRIRSRAVAASAGFALVVLPMALVLALRQAPPEDRRQAAAGYAAVVEEVAVSAGTILEIELKPGISDLRDQAYAADTLRGFSDRWASDLADLRERLDASDVPVGFERAHQGYLEALDGYRQVALILSRAADAEGAEQEQIIGEAIDLGRRTDETWDRAQDLLAERLREQGLDPTRWLPVWD